MTLEGEPRPLRHKWFREAMLERDGHTSYSRAATCLRCGRTKKGYGRASFGCLKVEVTYSWSPGRVYTATLRLKGVR